MLAYTSANNGRACIYVRVLQSKVYIMHAHVSILDDRSTSRAVHACVNNTHACSGGPELEKFITKMTTIVFLMVASSRSSQSSQVKSPRVGQVSQVVKEEHTSLPQLKHRRLRNNIVLTQAQPSPKLHPHPSLNPHSSSHTDA